MKWSIIVLVVVGLVAALAAAVLVGAMKAQVPPPSRSQPRLVSVLYATHSLPPLAVVDPNAVESRQEPIDKAPRGYIGDASQVVGRVVYAPVVKGQPFVSGTFATSKTGLGLASAVRKGMRAFTLSLEPEAALSGLLYPGSIVDILASVKVPSADGELDDEPASITILHGVQVMAIEDRTVVSHEDDEKTAGGKSLVKTGKRRVTVMVDPNQAQTLQLAQGHGSLSLAMRNPLEDTFGDITATRMSQVCQVLGRNTPPEPPRLPELTTQEVGPPASQPQWTVIILRAGKESTEKFPMPEPNR